jgi:hypothetical protein
VIANAFIGLPKPPTEAEVGVALGKARSRWDRLLAALAPLCDGRTWGSSGKRHGWSLRLQRKERVIVYLTPGKGELMASFALGDRAMSAARAAGLPPSVVAVLDSARRYAEGHAVRLEVKTAADVDAVVELARLKIAH